MEAKCEVIGWLLVEADRAQVLIRDENGDVSLQAAPADNEFRHQAIQTGAFRRGNPIIDPVTHETLGYEMEKLSSPIG
jgi:hypothetical protein